MYSGGAKVEPRDFDRINMPENLLPVIRYSFYLFVFAIPFETASTETVSIIGSIPMIIGMALTGAALLQPRVCFNTPPWAFWCFVGYFVLCLALGITENLDYLRFVLSRLFTFVQMLILMWICFNIFRYPEIRRNALLTFVAACAALAILQMVGIGTVSVGQGRSSLFGDNANTSGATLSLGLIALVGIAYGRITIEKRVTLFAWTMFPIIGTAIIMTGSRGALLGLVLGIALLIIRDGTLKAKLKIVSIAVLAIGFLVLAALSDDGMRMRLERSYYLGETAGRDKIHAHAWMMVFEKPMLGWGPVYNVVELGSRLGLSVRDTHSLYLSVLTETGLLGSILFFGGLGLLVRAAWQARVRIEGALPMAMLSCLLIINLSGSWQYRKLFWLTAAYVLASAWTPRATACHGPIQFPEPINVANYGAGTLASYPQTTGVEPEGISAQPERPT
jgi:O-antigen ligase